MNTNKYIDLSFCRGRYGDPLINIDRGKNSLFLERFMGYVRYQLQNHKLTVETGRVRWRKTSGLDIQMLCIQRNIVTFRKARVTEANLLTDLTVRSKAYWGYSEYFMEACADELVVPKEKLADPRFSYVIVELENEMVGYYGLEPVSCTKIELSALFIEPEFIGKGVGKLALNHAMNSAIELGGKELTLQSDPNAEGFYLANGGVLTGKRESQIFPGRYLPTFSILLQNMGLSK